MDERLRLAHERANRGVESASAGDLQGALEHYDAALEVFRELGTPGDVARVIGNRAAAYTGLGRPLDALAGYRSALEHHRSTGDRARMASTLTNLGQLELGVGNLGTAGEHLDEAVALHDVEGSELYAAFTRAIRANCTRARGEPEAARRELRDAEVALHQCGEPVLAAVARGARAMAELEDGLLTEALEGFEATLPTLEGRFAEPHAHYLMGYGEALSRSGDPRSGAAMLRVAEGLIRERDWPLGLALVATTRARMLARSGQMDAARQALGRARDMAAALHAGPASPLGQDLVRTAALIS